MSFSKGNRLMKRVVFAVFWTFVFLFLSLFCFAFAATIANKGDPSKQPEVEEAGRKWVGPMFLGSLVAAVALSACRVLPGTRRRRAVTTGPGAQTDFDFPPARPTVALPVGTPEDPPPELAALGPPLRVHAPGRLASMSGLARFATFVLGLLLVVAAVAVIRASDPIQLSPSASKGLFLGAVAAFLTCLVIAGGSRSTHTYQVHHDALVVSDRETLRILPWNQIQALIPGVPFFKDPTVVTRDGQELPIKAGTRYRRELLETVSVLLRDHLLPLMIKKAHAGRMVEFGPLGVSSYTLNYKGKTTPWDEVTRLLILTGMGMCKLTVYRCSGLGVLPFIQINLDRVPNRLLLIELLKQIAPPRLLVPNQARW
jgi:hypothetical protein